MATMTVTIGATKRDVVIVQGHVSPASLAATMVIAFRKRGSVINNKIAKTVKMKLIVQIATPALAPQMNLLVNQALVYW